MEFENQIDIDNTDIIEGQLLLERCSEDGRDWEFLKNAIEIASGSEYISLWEKLVQHAGNEVRITIETL